MPHTTNAANKIVCIFMVIQRIRATDTLSQIRVEFGHDVTRFRSRSLCRTAGKLSYQTLPMRPPRYSIFL